MGPANEGKGYRHWFRVYIRSSRSQHLLHIPNRPVVAHKQDGATAKSACCGYLSRCIRSKGGVRSTIAATDMAVLIWLQLYDRVETKPP